jgi:hypothetical protein
MAIEPQPLPPELPGPGEDIPPAEVPTPTDPIPTPEFPPQAYGRPSGSLPDDAESGEAMRQHLEKAETGDMDAALRIDQLRKVNQPAVDAAEQEESDGPKGLGLAR